MATFGSTINPALGRVDYSPLMQGAGMASQGIMQGAQGMAQGIGAGIERFQKNKEEEKAASAAIKTSETLIKGLRSLAEQKDDNGNPLIPQPMIAALDQFAGTVSDPSLSTRERAMIAKQGVQQFSGLLNAGMSAAQMRSALTENSAKTNLITQQAATLALELEQTKKDNAALAKAIQQISGGGDVVGSFIAAGGSVKGAETLKAFIPKPKEVPTGYRQAAGGNLEMIPGGPADVAAQAAKESADREKARLDLERERVDLTKKEAAAKSKEVEDKKKAQEDAAKALYEQGKVKAAVMLENINRAKQIVESGWTQGAGSTMFGWTPTAASLDAAYMNIGGNTALETIAEARKASPTGGSPFGQLNQKELEVAMGSKGVLNRQITEKDAMTNLKRIERLLLQAYPDLKKNEGNRDVRNKTGLGGQKTPAMPALPSGWNITK